MQWRDKFVEHFASGYLGGITLDRWLQMLAENRFSISPLHCLRALSTTIQTPLNSLMKQVEDIKYGKDIRSTVIRPPLFVIGHWRSGTTHLQQLLAADNRFATPNLYQVLFPHTFLTTERFNSQIVNFFLPRVRGFDNVRQHIQMPHEDEIAICTMSGNTCYLSLVFTQRTSHYDRFLTFRRTTRVEREQWRDDLQWFLKKVSFRYGKPLILKSPPHTSRIAMLLDMFPDARFIHIYRKPYAVFQSMVRLMEQGLKLGRLQRNEDFDIEERALRLYREMHDAYFDERPQIPDGHLCEAAFEDLERNPLRELKRIYELLDLPNFQHCERAVRSYLDTIVGYKKNEFPAIPIELRKRIKKHWQRAFEMWKFQE